MRGWVSRRAALLWLLTSGVSGCFLSVAGADFDDCPPDAIPHFVTRKTYPVGSRLNSALSDVVIVDLKQIPGGIV